LYFTKQYKQQIKHKINSLNKDLEEVVRTEYSTIYKTDAEMTTNILNAIDDVITKLQTCTIDEIVMINAVIDKYKENKEWFAEYAAAEFLRIE